LPSRVAGDSLAFQLTLQLNLYSKLANYIPSDSGSQATSSQRVSTPQPLAPVRSPKKIKVGIYKHRDENEKRKPVPIYAFFSAGDSKRIRYRFDEKRAERSDTQFNRKTARFDEIKFSPQFQKDTEAEIKAYVRKMLNDPDVEGDESGSPPPSRNQE
jgi:hypothetical protein